MITNAIKDAIIDSWPILTLFIVVISSVRITYLINKKEKISFHKEFGNLLFIIYALLLYKILTNTEHANNGLNLIPFQEILRYDIHSELFLYNVIGNICIFLPFGYFVSNYIKAKNISQILLLSIISSATVEGIQYRIGRAFDIDDIILNIVGSILGFVIYISLQAVKDHLPKILQKDIIYDILCIIILVILVLYLSKIFGLGIF
jgi:glycopeptide antibiotics resistance protein